MHSGTILTATAHPQTSRNVRIAAFDLDHKGTFRMVDAITVLRQDGSQAREFDVIGLHLVPSDPPGTVRYDITIADPDDVVPVETTIFVRARFHFD